MCLPMDFSKSPLSSSLINLYPPPNWTHDTMQYENNTSSFPVFLHLSMHMHIVLDDFP
jgi:hypothetical protein